MIRAHDQKQLFEVPISGSGWMDYEHKYDEYRFTDNSSSATNLESRLMELASHLRGKILMATLKLKHRIVMRDAEPLADLQSWEADILQEILYTAEYYEEAMLQAIENSLPKDECL